MVITLNLRLVCKGKIMFETKNGFMVESMDSDKEIGLVVEAPQTVYLTYRDLLDMLEMFAGELL